MSNYFLSSFIDVASFIGYLCLAILILLLMITIHEFGHFISGKIFGFGIEEFSIGFGPKLFQKKNRNGEIFSIRLIPLGGYCAFTGEDKEIENANAFNNKKPWQRLIVLLSGAFMNYVFAIIIISCMFCFYGKTSIMAYNVRKNPDVSAERSLQSKDVILKSNGKNVFLITDLMISIENKNKGDFVVFDIYRNGDVLKDYKIELQYDTFFANLEDNLKLCNALGMDYFVDGSGEIIDSGFRTTGIKLNFFNSIGLAFVYSFKLAGTIFIIIKQLFTGMLGIGSLGGTITTISVTAEVIKNGGIWSLLNISSFIGVNLAVFNLLPIPALDGARALFTLIEWVTGRPLNRKIESIIHTLGFIILILFAIFIDVQRLFI